MVRPHQLGNYSTEQPDQGSHDLAGQIGQNLPEVPDIESGKVIVAKIGGSTLGDHDTTLKDIVALQRSGSYPVVVHGGGKIVSDWMIKAGVRPKFVGGLRVTDKSVLDIVVAVLTGVVNKSIVASLQSHGGKSIGISGVDGQMLVARQGKPELGLVGDTVVASSDPIRALLNSGYIPVIAPVALCVSENGELAGSMLNVNADTAAGEIAASLNADNLVFLTDVEGVLDSSRRLIPRLTKRQAHKLMKSDVIEGGMIPKLEACLTALQQVDYAQIADGRKPGAILDLIAGKERGTRVG